MKLSDSQRRCLKMDRLVLDDLDLEMPRQSAKYVAAAFTLAHLEKVSPYFVHLQAARKGVKTVYRDLRAYGYTWDVSRQEWVKDE